MFDESKVLGVFRVSMGNGKGIAECPFGLWLYIDHLMVHF
jgi:hypothetical protein